MKSLSRSLFVLSGLTALAALVFVTGRPGPSSGPEIGKAAGKIPNDWFHVQRAYPETDYPHQAVTRAVESARADFAALGRAVGGQDAIGPEDHSFGSRGTTPGQWDLAGPVNIGGRITALTAHEDEPDRIYAGIAAGGVFRSTDGGASWAPIFDETGVLSIGDIEIDPVNPDIIYVGTGEANASGDSFAGNGMYRSTDAGDTWTSIGLEDSRHIGRIVIDPSDTDRIFVAVMGGLWSTGTNRGVYRTTNAGANWEQILYISDTTSIVDLAIDPVDPSRVYAASWERLRGPDFRMVAGETSGVHRSTDGGDSWSELTNGLPSGSDVGRIGLALAPSDPQTIYAIYADDPGYFAGLFKTTNGGDSWSRVNDSAIDDVFASFGWYFGTVRVSPTNPDEVYAMGLILYRSGNGGNTWSERFQGAHVDHHDLWIDPNDDNRMFLASDGGVYISDNAGSNWSHVQTLPITQFYAGTVDPQLPERVYGGAQDNGTSRTVTGDIDDWEPVYGGDGFYCLVYPTNSNRIWASWQNGNLVYTSNGGNSWSSATNGIPSSDRKNWNTPVVMDPSDPDRRYYGSHRMWRSTSSTAWTNISGDLTDGGSGGYHTITTIAVAATDGDRIYVGTADGRVHTTSNGGSNWTAIEAGLPDRWVTRVAVDPFDDEVAYVAHSGYRWDEATPHLHRTTDAGATWTAIDGDLPDAPVNAFLVDPEASNRLFAGTDVGVYISQDTGATWEPFGSGLPICVIHDLHFHAPTRSLVAFTHARSAYRTTVSATTDVAGSESNSETWIALRSRNPFQDDVRVQLQMPSGFETGRLSIFDAQGREMGSQVVSREATGREVVPTGVAALARGVYFVRWGSATEAWGTVRIVKD